MATAARVRQGMLPAGGVDMNRAMENRFMPQLKDKRVVYNEPSRTPIGTSAGAKAVAGEWATLSNNKWPANGGALAKRAGGMELSLENRYTMEVNSFQPSSTVLPVTVSSDANSRSAMAVADTVYLGHLNWNLIEAKRNKVIANATWQLSLPSLLQILNSDIAKYPTAAEVMRAWSFFGVVLQSSEIQGKARITHFANCTQGACDVHNIWGDKATRGSTAYIRLYREVPKQRALINKVDVDGDSSMTDGLGSSGKGNGNGYTHRQGEIKRDGDDDEEDDTGKFVSLVETTADVRSIHEGLVRIFQQKPMTNAELSKWARTTFASIEEGRDTQLMEAVNADFLAFLVIIQAHTPVMKDRTTEAFGEAFSTYVTWASAREGKEDKDGKEDKYDVRDALKAQIDMPKSIDFTGDGIAKRVLDMYRDPSYDLMRKWWCTFRAAQLKGIKINGMDGPQILKDILDIKVGITDFDDARAGLVDAIEQVGDNFPYDRKYNGIIEQSGIWSKLQNRLVNRSYTASNDQGSKSRADTREERRDIRGRDIASYNLNKRPGNKWGSWVVDAVCAPPKKKPILKNLRVIDDEGNWSVMEIWFRIGTIQGERGAFLPRAVKSALSTPVTNGKQAKTLRAIIDKEPYVQILLRN